LLAGANLFDSALKLSATFRRIGVGGVSVGHPSDPS
jgi:hypothetical protein